LREETESADEEEPVAVTLGAEEVEVAALLLELVLEADSLLDLSVLEEDSLVSLIAVGVVCESVLATSMFTRADY